MFVRSLTLLCCLLLPAAATAEPARVAIIIDDLGNSLELGRQAVELPGELTYSILPQLPYSADIAVHANDQGKEVMLHLPMQAGDGRTLGPGGLYKTMSREDFTRELRVNLETVPHVVGVNNHMGSMLTQYAEPMRWLMQDLRCLGDLYFVDSRTDVRTVARELARESGIANAQRDVFLDNDPDPEAVRAQLQRLIDKAKRRGSAIAIGHPYPQTLAVLAEQLPQLAEQGIELVPVSDLVEQRRNTQSWHACSSPLQTAAKNLKP